ncbi:MAG TPA: Qat anti-phage system QueC-like protein QatC [Pyrinomonadaceae bacterium]|jgi:hypothetical protein|nr:Qat anti-phage system QueC-like protein QatC [Pyrinomonadaceae bacterium]
MRTVVATVQPSRANAARKRDAFPIVLYDVGTEKLAGVGHPLAEQARAFLPAPPSVTAWDFLSIALAVFGTDRFLLRSSAVDGWTREIALEVELADPEPWNALREQIAATLRFLTGDIWKIAFRPNGSRPPTWHPKLTDRDCICLFSGGLDSFIGAADLLDGKRFPLLVSQASPKEGQTQEYLACQLRLDQNRFEGKSIERHVPPYEASSRSRSILFLAYGVIAASGLHTGNDRVEVFLPENGLISINPPFYRRRMGSLSTRTTHPHFIGQLQSILDSVGLKVVLTNRYRGKTKGEMLVACKNQIVRKFAHVTYSCGKGKRLNQHCGRCVPCLIRRAAFSRANIDDRTGYWAEDLSTHSNNDDVFAARLAVAQLKTRNIARWVNEPGPLPYDPAERGVYLDVVHRGLKELEEFLSGISWQ